MMTEPGPNVAPVNADLGDEPTRGIPSGPTRSPGPSFPIILTTPAIVVPGPKRGPCIVAAKEPVRRISRMCICNIN